MAWRIGALGPACRPPIAARFYPSRPTVQQGRPRSRRVRDVELTIATCRELPEPDPDAAPLAKALETVGVRSRLLAWDDPEVDWSRAGATLFRSTWNYPQHAESFMQWVEETSRHGPMWNPADVVLWNVHKGYLLELAEAGLAVTPTVLLARGSGRSLQSVMSEQGWSRAVVKPAISAASYRTLLVDAVDSAAGEQHLRLLAAEGDVLVQAYMESVEDYGERALVWIDGDVTHSVRKTPRWHGEAEHVSEAMPVTPAESALAQDALALVRSPLLYARVDVAPGESGAPVIMELELIEPSLFFPQHPPALQRYVAGIRHRLS